MRSTSRSRWARAAGRGFALFALALATSGLAAGCGGSEAVGRPCELGTMPLEGVNGQIATATSPALECPSHICLLPGADRDARSPAQITTGVSGTGPLCTASCASNSDCADAERGNPDNPADHRCRGGFACLWPMTVGAFACQKLCVCTDFVVPPVGGFKKPAACE
jgi:hypothetical protein